MNKPKLFWEPDPDISQKTRMVDFAGAVKRRFGFDWQEDSEKLWEWSVSNRDDFWSLVWDTQEIIGAKGNQILHPGQHMAEDRFFPDAKLNFTENLLRNADEREAIISLREDGRRVTFSRRELKNRVHRLAGFLEAKGVGSGDVVAAYMPNTPETVISMLAAAMVGAAFSSCSCDFGAEAAIDRLSQTRPKVLIAALEYQYSGKTYDRRGNIGKICEALPDLSCLITVPFDTGDTCEDLPNIRPEQISWPAAEKDPGDKPYSLFGFDHPLYMLFSSGTTGLPKTIIHGAGGTLLQHMKEHALHVDIHPGDRVFYFTTCGWMMWNWLVSALAQEAAIVLYEGNPAHPSEGKLWEIAQAEQISFMGVSAKYIDSLRKKGFDVRSKFDLSNLRTICSTGSPLSEDGYAYVYEQVKADVHLASISGGTDIVSCFALGCPVRPVYGGVLQMRGLGMSIDVWSDAGDPMTGGQGELVCTKSFPSMPTGFGNDPDGEKYRSAYFEHFDGVWRHGDWATLTDDGGLIIHGRSDATLNPGGVRIGTAEIYRICEKFPEISESLAVGVMQGETQHIVMFLVMSHTAGISQKLQDELSSAIRTQASPRHVPSHFVPVPDLPKTRSGKISELAVRDIMNGKGVKNKNSLSNPEMIGFFEDLVPSVSKALETIERASNVEQV